MQKEEAWESYAERIKRLAKRTYKYWMPGMDLVDIEQELWTELFSIQRKKPSASEGFITSKLKIFSRTYVRRFRDKTFDIMGFNAEEPKDDQDVYWKCVIHCWDLFVKRLSKTEAAIMRLAAQGCSNYIIATAVGKSLSSVKRIRTGLVRAFKSEVEENVKKH